MSTRPEFANLGIKGVLVDPPTTKAHPKLLVGGVWCICDIEYLHTEDARVSPWILGSIKPIQLSKFDFEGYLAARLEFTKDEWVDLLVQSIGFQPPAVRVAGQAHPAGATHSVR